MFGIFLLFLTFFIGGDCIIVGKLEGAKLIANVYQTKVFLTQEQCICEMVKSINLISALNYFSTNQTCQLFSSSLVSFDIELSANSLAVFTNQSNIANIFRKFMKKNLIFSYGNIFMRKRFSLSSNNLVDNFSYCCYTKKKKYPSFT